MSTDSFNLAPAQTSSGATATAPAPIPTQPTAAGPNSKTSPKKKTKTQQPEADGTLAGVIIPGAALTTFIGLCWLIHQFGLPAVILAILACAAAATAALALKARRGARKAGRGLGSLLPAAGAGPGKTRLPTTKQQRPRTGGGSGTRKPMLNPSRTPGPGRTMNNGSPKSGSLLGGGGSGRSTGPASRKPNGLGSDKALKNGAGRNLSGRTNKAPKQKPGAGSLLSSGKQAAATGGKGALGLFGPGGTSGNQNGAGARKQKQNNSPNRSKHAKTRTLASAWGTGAKLARNFKRKNGHMKPAADKGHHKNRPTPGTPTRPVDKKTGRASKTIAAASRKNRGATVRTPKPQHLKTKSKKTTPPGKKRVLKTNRPASHRAPMGRLRRATYQAGVKLRKHTSRTTRLRIRKVISPMRTALRTTGSIISKPLATAWRHVSRDFLDLHMLIGSIGYTSGGPNWARPLAKVLHAITTPAARVIAASGSWTWLSRWMYRHTTQPRTTTPGPAAATPPTRPAPAGPRTAVRPPADAAAEHLRATVTATAAPKGTPAMGSEIHASAPLAYAADAVRTAGVLLLVNPAENMLGYEATMRQLADVQAAIGDVIRAAAISTREDFAVNPAVSDAYDDTAAYARSIANRLDAIPQLFRLIHAEQLANIDNPTVQAAKWDVLRNQ